MRRITPSWFAPVAVGVITLGAIGCAVVADQNDTPETPVEAALFPESAAPAGTTVEAPAEEEQPLDVAGTGLPNPNQRAVAVSPAFKAALDFLPPDEYRIRVLIATDGREYLYHDDRCILNSANNNVLCYSNPWERVVHIDQPEETNE